VRRVTGPIVLWPGGAPGSEDWSHREVIYTDDDGGERVRNVVVPTLTPFLPQAPQANGTAVIVAPGGGFRFLSWDYEGTHVAQWLADRGVAAFVLKYRLVDTEPDHDAFRTALTAWAMSLLARPEGPAVQSSADLGPIVSLAVADGEQAVRTVRGRAGELGIDPARIGLMGFSAGAFLTAGVAVTTDASARPDFVAPIYGGSVDAEIPADAPPMFSVVAADDGLCVDTNLRLAEAWRQAGRPIDLHVFSRGGHGFGTKKIGLPVDGWLDLFHDWLTTL
jgi:acetyl esterase/lipase